MKIIDLQYILAACNSSNYNALSLLRTAIKLAGFNKRYSTTKNDATSFHWIILIRDIYSPENLEGQS